MAGQIIRNGILLITLWVATLGAQSGAPAFDVVSVKRSASTENNWAYGPRPGGQFVATNALIRPLIAYAYNVRDVQVVGGPDWLESRRFDIVAKTGTGDVPFDRLRELLQSLLADRFKLVTHPDTRERPLFVLALAREDGTLGPALHRSSVNCSGLPKGLDTPLPKGSRPVCGIIGNDTSIIGGAVPLKMIADALAGRVNGVVVDQTGLSGGYDFDLSFTPDVRTGDTPAGAAGPSLFTAVQEQLGLRLRAQRGPVDVVVIDSVEQPAEN